ncbi:MAG: DUF4347 domain-containing protein, partial [Deltaproteobacteria bacterium]|nr:DUF4347 domain-containing protein [Deltaproteobacteria bacterium]
MFRNSNNLLRRVNKPAEKHPDILRYEELEQRVLFSADVIPGVDMPAADEQVVIEDVSGGTQAEPEASAETADQAASESRLELVFVNENVPDYDLLISGLEGGDANRIIELVILDPGRDGIEQVSEILAQRSDLAAVHFISHGADGQINLGNTFLNHNTLQLNSEAVAGWGDALTDSGDFLFYGCNIAADDAGQSLLNDIAALAGVDVAASEDPTGHESLGGDWDLEYASGAIETESPVGSDAQESWIRLLGEHTISDNFAYSGSPYNNSDGTDEWSSSWEILSGVGGYDAVIFDGSKLSIGGDDAVDDIVDYGVKRQADLPVAVSATLSLDVVFSGGEQHGFGVSLEVSSTGEDGSWVTLNTFYLNSDLSTLQDPISFQEDISSYCGGTIWVRLLGIQEGDDSDFDPLGDSASIDFHNLQIAYTTTNDAPVIDSAALTVIEGQTVALSDADFGITDPDDSNFTYTLSGISGGYFQLSSNVGVAITTFTSADLTGGLVQFVDDGNEVAPAFSVTVNDGDSDSNTFAATITYTAANDEPLLAAIANQSVDEGATLTFTASASDADLPADTLTYSLDATSTAAGMTINASTGTFSWSPTEAQNGDHSVTVTVSDGDLSDSETFTITVNEVNTAPVLDSASLTLNEGETFTLGGANFGITDPDD